MDTSGIFNIEAFRLGDHIVTLGGLLMALFSVVLGFIFTDFQQGE